MPMLILACGHTVSQPGKQSVRFTFKVECQGHSSNTLKS